MCEAGKSKREDFTTVPTENLAATEIKLTEKVAANETVCSSEIRTSSSTESQSTLQVFEPNANTTAWLCHRMRPGARKRPEAKLCEDLKRMFHACEWRGNAKVEDYGDDGLFNLPVREGEFEDLRRPRIVRALDPVIPEKRHHVRMLEDTL